LVAALCAVFSLGALLTGLLFGEWPPGTLTLTRWHGHEMLFGFVGAAIAGLLLTAAPAWTGSRPVAGAPLAALLGFRQGHRTLRMPIVWILHAGYGWLVVGLALKALWLVGHVTMGLNWLHALTAGAFGTMILGVMTRVALGHTGRQLEVPGSITLAYVLVIVGAMLRVLASAAMPNLYPVTLVVAGVLWSGAFVIFAVVYLPILLGPRVDAQSV
jgi:uncharacterized protein involved in response to NO